MSSRRMKKQNNIAWSNGPSEPVNWTPRNKFEYCEACGSEQHSEWDCPRLIRFDNGQSVQQQQEVDDDVQYNNSNSNSSSEVSNSGVYCTDQGSIWQRLKRYSDINSSRENSETLGNFILERVQQQDGELNAEQLIQEVSQGLKMDPVVGGILVYSVINSDARLKLNGRIIRRARPAVVPLLQEVKVPLNDSGPLRSARRMRKYEEHIAAVDGTVQSETEYFQHTTIATLKRCLQRVESIRENMTPRTPKQDQDQPQMPPPYTPRTPKHQFEDFNESDEDEFYERC